VNRLAGSPSDEAGDQLAKDSNDKCRERSRNGHGTPPNSRGNSMQHHLSHIFIPVYVRVWRKQGGRVVNEAGLLNRFWMRVSGIPPSILDVTQ